MTSSDKVKEKRDASNPKKRNADTLEGLNFQGSSPRPRNLYETLPVELRVMIMQKLDEKSVLALREACLGALAELELIAQLHERGQCPVWPKIDWSGGTSFDPDVLKGWYWIFQCTKPWTFWGNEQIDVIPRIEHDVFIHLSGDEEEMKVMAD